MVFHPFMNAAEEMEPKQRLLLPTKYCNERSTLGFLYIFA